MNFFEKFIVYFEELKQHVSIHFSFKYEYKGQDLSKRAQEFNIL